MGTTTWLPKHYIWDNKHKSLYLFIPNGLNW